MDFKGLKAWKGFQQFKKLPPSQRKLVFYAESASDWAFFSEIIEACLSKGVTLTYLTSDSKDPLLESPRITAFYIGMGSLRTALFQTLEVDTLVLTMPDLHQYYLKRSKGVRRYVYVFHSMASTHVRYRKGAFDHYDEVLCVGSYHYDEIRKWEKLKNLPEKKLIPHGYARLDQILKKGSESGKRAGETKRVLVAPTWGEASLIGRCEELLLDRLLKMDLEVTLRLHPMTVRHEKKRLKAFQAREQDTPRFRLEASARGEESFLSADLVITDWSGAGLDFAFGVGRPVLSINTPKKVENPEFNSIGLPAFEDAVREEIGGVLSPPDLDGLEERVEEALARSDHSRITQARDEKIFNIGSSGKAGAEYLVETTQF